MPVAVTALLAGPKARPSAETLAELLTTLWEEELVAPRAVVSVGPVFAERVVTGRDRVGEGRRVAWTGTDLAGLLAAVRAASGEDLAVWFDAVDLDAFEPAEEEEYEDVEDVGDDEDDDAPAAAPRAPAPPPEDLSLGEFELVAPALCVYAVRTPVELEERNLSPKAKPRKLKRFGPASAWLTLAGEDVGLLVDDLGDSWLRDVVEEALGPVKIGKLLG